MPLLQKLLNKLNGLHYGQEYLCLALEKMQQPLYAYFINRNREVIRDITSTHLFVGYKPVILALTETGTTLLQQSTPINIAFTMQSFDEGATIKTSSIIAILSLQKIKAFSVGDRFFYYYEGISGKHTFLNRLHTSAFLLNNRLYNKKKGNIYLDANLYRQVQIAYSIPRKISVITTGASGLYNVFPTDLHGQAGDYYIISLRTGGKACEQVMQAEKIVLSDMDVSASTQVYALGKNHMQPLKEKNAFTLLSNKQSLLFGLPLPLRLIRYKELVLQSHMQHGIHTLFFFKIVYQETISQSEETLSHIHNVYATWRFKHNIPTEYIPR